MLNASLLRTLPLAAAVVLAACSGPSSGQPSAASPTPAATATGVLVEPTAVPGSTVAAAPGLLLAYETRGGECPDGPCGERIEIQVDGTVRYESGPLGQVSPELLERLTSAIEAADWDAILGVPFEGECPVNVDGQEQVFTFNVDGSAIVVASCTISVDPAAEPFSTVQEVLFGPGG